MRVACIFPDGAVAAYRLGRIEDGVHNTDVFQNHIHIDDFLKKLAELAAEEHPGAKIEIQRMVLKDGGEHGDESEWIPIEEFDPEVHTPTGAGNRVAQTLTTGADIQVGNGKG